MKKSKVMALLLAAAMATAPLAGCGTSGGSTGAGDEAVVDEASILNPPGTLPIVKEPITLTIFAPADGENDRAENLQTKEIEEATGIKIEWQVAASSDNVSDKLSTMFASQEMTDLIMLGAGQQLDKATEAMIASQGLVIPVDEYIENSENYKKAFDEIEGLREYMTTPDGHIYSLPNVDGSLHMQYPDKLWINTTWLDNLGLEMPTTTEEFENVLKAFKEHDANGNGDPNDEIPLSTVTGIANGIQIDGFLMNPFQLTPDIDKLYLDNGKVTFAPTTDGYKEGLKYLNSLYEQGLINPESFTQDKATQINTNEAGEEPVIGAFLALRPGYACDLSSVPNSEKWEQYEPLPPLEGPDGQRVSAWNPYVGFQSGMTFISSNCKYPEVAFRLLDYLVSEEMTYRSALGIEGVHWVKAEEGEKGLDGSPALYKKLNADTTNQIWGQLCLIRTSEFVDGECFPVDPYAEDVPPLVGRQIPMYQGSVDQQDSAQPLESVLPQLYMSEESASELALLKTNVMDTQRESMVQFITGTMDIDQNWDTYLADLESVGLSRYLEILQEAYDNSVYAK